MSLVDCKTYAQSKEKGTSTSLRDACRYCGKTKEWHLKLNKQIMPSDIVAQNWLIKKGYSNSSFYEMAKNLLNQFIQDHGCNECSKMDL